VIAGDGIGQEFMPAAIACVEDVDGGCLVALLG
jgi:isocitrate/isopropylmalate dehydrogenase